MLGNAHDTHLSCYHRQRFQACYTIFSAIKDGLSNVPLVVKAATVYGISKEMEKSHFRIRQQSC